MHSSQHLVLRPDITPSIARAVAKYFSEEDMPVRLCYVANTFINHSDFQGRLKETTQLGAEMIGDGSVEADAEMIANKKEEMKIRRAERSKSKKLAKAAAKAQE